ncbi:MAG TPA: lipid-binding SYLF domain-containing protein [Steroidobacteraceae bacterium]|nr:lipid-binding SYLF domain-containing protein [Steroidobacteraceae bacterium]
MHNRVGLYCVLSTTLLLGAAVAHGQAREEGRVLTAAQVLQELRGTPDGFIPDRLLERAYGIAVVPDVTKAAFFLGGRRGNGVLVVRDKQGRFSNPMFINLTGGSFGFQWGIQSTDIVLVFTTQHSIDKITGGKITLGADASVAAGPVGRQASAATDPTISSEVYSYSRNRGLFIGISLDGSALTVDSGADARFYDRGTVNATDIVAGTVTRNDEITRRFQAALNASTGSAIPASASAAPIGTAGSVPVSMAPNAQTAAPAAAAQGAQSFPLPDPHPGQEPPTR